jgi:hypothetical protein
MQVKLQKFDSKDKKILEGSYIIVNVNDEKKG